MNRVCRDITVTKARSSKKFQEHLSIKSFCSRTGLVNAGRVQPAFDLGNAVL